MNSIWVIFLNLLIFLKNEMILFLRLERSENLKTGMRFRLCSLVYQQPQENTQITEKL